MYEYVFLVSPLSGLIHMSMFTQASMRGAHSSLGCTLSVLRTSRMKRMYFYEGRGYLLELN